MGRLNLLIKIAGLIYIASIIKSRGKSKRPLFGIGLLIIYLLQKIHELGCWKYKLKNKDIRISYYKPGTGSLIKTIECAENNFHPQAVKEILKNIKETREPFAIYGMIKLNHNPNYNYHIFDPKIIKYIFEDRFEDYIKGPMIQKTFEELFGIFLYFPFFHCVSSEIDSFCT